MILPVEDPSRSVIPFLLSLRTLIQFRSEAIQWGIRLLILRRDNRIVAFSMERSGYCRDGIYRSLRPPLVLPQDDNLSMTEFMFRNSDSYSGKPALIEAHSGETLTFSEFKSVVSRLSRNLTSLGVTKGDVVMILSPNSIRFPIFFYAAVAIGAVVTTANHMYTINEISKQAKDCQPKLVATVSDLVSRVRHFGLPVVLLDSSSSSSKSNISGIFYFTELVDASSPSRESRRIGVKQTDAAALLYSSGTTGDNKGVVLTHKNFIASALMITSDQDFYGEMHNVFACFLPMFHVFGLSVLLNAQLQRGNAVVSLPKFHLDTLLGTIEKYRVTHLWAVPPVVLELAKHGAVNKYDLSSLKFVGSGAAPLGKELMEACGKRVPFAVIRQGYGMTESCAIVSVENPRTGPRYTGSAGTLVAGVEAQIADFEKRSRLPPGKHGEIWIRGPNMMRGYLNNPRATKLTIDRDGWIHTGDVGYFDDEGRLFIIDRMKELIKYKGFQVAPSELEGVLLSHTEILDAAVIPLPDEKAGEVPMAFIVRSPDSRLNEADVQAFVAEQVAPFKRIRKVVFMAEIPKSAAGKVLRRELVAGIRGRL